MSYPDGKPMKVTDGSQKWKIGIMIVFGLYFVVWSILMLLK